MTIIIEKCWKNYKQLGMKKKGKKEVPNCVPESEMNEQLKDLMQLAVDEKPIEFEKNFHNYMVAKIQDKITDLKVDIATNMFNKEEVEQIDELSKGTLRSYVKKATKKRDNLMRKSSDAEDKAMSTDGMKYPDAQKKREAIANKLVHKYANKVQGVDRATAKLKK